MRVLLFRYRVVRDIENNEPSEKERASVHAELTYIYIYIQIKKSQTY